MAAKPREVSSSDAESDSESELVQEKQTRQRQHTKYQCPADFVFCDIRPCASTRLENVKDGDTELWLIKAPASFSPDSFSGMRVPVVGLETIQPRSRKQQVYSVLSTPVAVGDARLLSPGSQRTGGTLCAPAFSGIINICESYGDRRGHQVPMAIPACPAPLILEGLKQRFQPFGSRTLPGQGSEAGGPQEEGPAEGPAAAKRMRTDPEESAAPKKKKKKKKKDNDAVVAKEEMVEEEVSAAASHGRPDTPPVTAQEPAPGEEAVEKKKKKKKSKDRDRGEVEESGRDVETGLRLKEEVEVKTEQMDLACSSMENLVKKKKVKKEKKQTQD
ncbi:CD3e molecule, epsilon associated protein [Anguilla rostrata]|uniref:CD3e molecule, epsilon associated protein n=1 Tax=Anguilla rostrata TaxID=7938 RepID=UPI0030D5AAD7